MTVEKLGIKPFYIASDVEIAAIFSLSGSPGEQKIEKYSWRRLKSAATKYPENPLK